MNNNPYTTHTLDNGLKIVIETMPGVRSAAAGFLARTGSRDETRELAGVSHFLEHMCFKGTHNRTWQQITIDFDNLGSNYNAFTSHDRTFYYGWVPSANIEKQIELLADMMRSALPEDEFTMEKNVILEEIAMSHDRIEHEAYDFLHEELFRGHPLAWPILGYEETIEKLTRDQMYDYFQKRYAPDNLVLVVAGNVNPKEIITCAERVCGSWKPSGTNGKRLPHGIPKGKAVKVLDRFQQQIMALSYPAPSGIDPMHETAQAVASILGGGNSRIYWHVVQTGISPRAGAFRVDYSDLGLLILSGQTEPENIERLTDSLRKEAKDLMQGGAKEHEVQRAKNKARTGLAVEGETPYHRLTQIMDDVDYRGTARTVEERLAAIDAVSVKSIAEYFEQYPIDGEGHLVSIGPRAWPEMN